MSYIRVKNRQTNSNVYLQNRLNRFTRPPMTNGDLYVDKNETIGGNLAVSFNNKGGGQFSDVWLKGPGTFVYKASIQIK